LPVGHFVAGLKRARVPGRFCQHRPHFQRSQHCQGRANKARTGILQARERDQDREFQRKRREFQEDLNARKNEELQQVLEKANKVVKQVAESEKYDLILQEAVYINPKHDITDKVIKVINSGK
jgi:outer membrane protein